MGWFQAPTMPEALQHLRDVAAHDLDAVTAVISTHEATILSLAKKTEGLGANIDAEIDAIRAATIKLKEFVATHKLPTSVPEAETDAHQVEQIVTEPFQPGAAAAAEAAEHDELLPDVHSEQHAEDHPEVQTHSDEQHASAPVAASDETHEDEAHESAGADEHEEEHGSGQHTGSV